MLSLLTLVYPVAHKPPRPLAKFSHPKFPNSSCQQHNNNPVPFNFSQQVLRTSSMHVSYTVLHTVECNGTWKGSAFTIPMTVVSFKIWVTPSDIIKMHVCITIEAHQQQRCFHSSKWGRHCAFSSIHQVITAKKRAKEYNCSHINSCTIFWCDWAVVSIGQTMVAGKCSFTANRGLNLRVVQVSFFGFELWLSETCFTSFLAAL